MIHDIQAKESAKRHVTHTSTGFTTICTIRFYHQTRERLELVNHYDLRKLTFNSLM